MIRLLLDDGIARSTRLGKHVRTFWDGYVSRKFQGMRGRTGSERISRWRRNQVGVSLEARNVHVIPNNKVLTAVSVTAGSAL